MRGEVSWQVELSIDREQFDEFRSLTIEMIESTKLEKGVLVYERFFSEDYNKIFVYERYASSEAAISHLRTFREKFGYAFAQLAKRERFLVFGEPNQELEEILSSFDAKFLRPLGGFSALAIE